MQNIGSDKKDRFLFADSSRDSEPLIMASHAKLINSE